MRTEKEKKEKQKEMRNLLQHVGFEAHVGDQMRRERRRRQVLDAEPTQLVGAERFRKLENIAHTGLIHTFKN
jgi:hypothetical protein